MTMDDGEAGAPSVHHAGPDDDADDDAMAQYGTGLARMAGATHGARTLHVHPLSNYTFGSKSAKDEKDATVAEAMLRYKDKYEKEGLRRTVEAILLVNQHAHPHVLLLQSGGGPGGGVPTFKLPGGRLRHGEGEVAGLQRKLHNKLSPAQGSLRHEWECGDCVAQWCRPGFEPNYYPYLPAHVTRPKETRKIYTVQLPEKCFFAVPKNLKLLAVPLFELYNNEARYGAIIASIPYLISRYHLNLVRLQPDESPRVVTDGRKVSCSTRTGLFIPRSRMFTRFAATTRRSRRTDV